MATLFVYVWKNYSAIHVPDLNNALLDWEAPAAVQAFPGAEAIPSELSGDDYMIPFRFQRYPACQFYRFVGADDNALRAYIHRLGQGDRSCFKPNSLSVRWKNSFSMVAQCMIEVMPAQYARQRDIGKIFGKWDYRDLNAFLRAVAESDGYIGHFTNVLMQAQLQALNN